MSFLQQLEANFQPLLFASIFLALVLRFLYNKNKKRHTKLPPSPPKLPIIGNLHQLGNAPHKSLHCLAKNLGPIMYLKLGEIPTVVLSSASIAKEVIKTHDLALASRPQICSAKKLLYNCTDIGFAPYGSYWRQIRIICILEQLSTKRVQSFSVVREEEVARLIHRITESYPGTTNLSKMLALYANDVICRVAFGKIFMEGGEYERHGIHKLLEEFQELQGGLSIGDFFPSIESIIHRLTGLKSRLEDSSRRFDQLLDEIVEDHIRSGNEKDHKDIVDVLLEIQKKADLEAPITMENVKAIILASEKWISLETHSEVLSNVFIDSCFSVSKFNYLNLRFLNISGNSFLEGPVLVMSQVEHLSADLNRNNIVPKRYILAENSTRPNQISAMAPAPAPSHVVPVNEHKRNKKKRKLTAWFLGFLAGTFAGCISAVLLSVLYKMIMFFIRRGKNDQSLTIYSPLIKKPQDLAFLEKEDGVASLEMIGKGGCGEVYRAELPGSNGKIIAIKKIIQPPMDAADITEEDTKALNKKMRQVKSEIQIVGQIRHRNLLPLLAHMPRPDCHYLVYEYMKNGSLQDILEQVTEGTRELDWLGRHRIASGIAAGLEYLHINHTQRIIHRDLKPANVLLDDDMEARIADFGLAKAVPDAHTHATTSNVAGTVGYIAPEYHQTLKFTDKCDIYSFGVVLAVLVIGKLPSDEFFQHTCEMSLVKWLRNVMTSDDPKRAIVPKLIGNGYEEQVLLVLKITCFCTLDNPKERPNSKDVRCMLTQIKH
ncbi:hypothetical protein K7X08_031740 [Anisodus acutangulus]|uniref:Protein kinase domain-containing protein n=1 Tax=Anisodus acutangulus TaxID=402998 RepID=A0A9Q1MQ85_9SOLA|nr:hypothetical protein K7X08_031740 [Anisodus acutangulus]